jgi:hypothetical protein
MKSRSLQSFISTKTYKGELWLKVRDGAGRFVVQRKLKTIYVDSVDVPEIETAQFFK